MALAVSLFIYVFYRSEKTLINELIVALISLEYYAAAKACIVRALPLPGPIIFSLPGGLWIFCVTALSQNFYLKIRSKRILLSVVPIIFCVGLEVCQLLQLTNGRFDVLDIAFYGLFWLLASFGFQSRVTQQNIASPFTLHGFICVACFLSVYLAHVNQ